MRKTSLECVYELAKIDKRVVFIGSDLGAGTLNKFKSEFPDRFFMEGISEQHIIGLATGLALDGFIVYINTIATFLTRRCFEQNVINLGLHNLNVRLIASGGGTVYAPLGPTHIALDDIAIMNTIPNMTIISVADSIEMKSMMRQTLYHKGPIYIRLGKGGDPIITPKKRKFIIGSYYKYFKGDNVAIISTGITTDICIKTAEILNQKSVSVEVYHFPTIKPFNKSGLIRSIKNKDMVVVVEEHSEIGGLGSIVSSILMTKQIKIKYLHFAFSDKFFSQYGNQKDLLNLSNINERKISKKILNNLLKSNGKN